MATLRNGQVVDFTGNRCCASIVWCRCGRRGTPVKEGNGVRVIHRARIQDGRIVPTDSCKG